MSFISRFRKETGAKRFLREKTGCWRRNIKVGDKIYGDLQRAEVNTFLEWDLTDEREYSKEKFDCEKFALCTMCNAQLYFIDNFNINPPFGMCWVSGPEGMHAINLYIYESHDTVVYIEPQTDEEYFLNGEKVRFILM